MTWRAQIRNRYCSRLQYSRLDCRVLGKCHGCNVRQYRKVHNTQVIMIHSLYLSHLGLMLGSVQLIPQLINIWTSIIGMISTLKGNWLAPLLLLLPRLQAGYLVTPHLHIAHTLHSDSTEERLSCMQYMYL